MIQAHNRKRTPVGKSQVDLWKALLKDYKVLYIGIKAPLSVLEAREEVRSNRIHGSSCSIFSSPQRYRL